MCRRWPVEVGISRMSSAAPGLSDAGTRYSGLTSKYGSGAKVARSASFTGDSGERMY